MPSEAEWEYAARAGQSGRYSFGDDESQLRTHAWFANSSGAKTQPVGRKPANAFGLHDMHGNVAEWVEDCMHMNYVGAPSNGSARVSGCSGGSSRVIRGGAWNSNHIQVRSSTRAGLAQDARNAFTGFRLARSL